MNNTNCYIPAEDIIKVAKLIGRCDFRTTVSRYATSDHCPWVITVGEDSWQRHLVVCSLGEGIDGFDAELAVLATSESSKFGYDVRTDNVERRIDLSVLIADNYIGVKRVLYPPKETI